MANTTDGENKSGESQDGRDQDGGDQNEVRTRRRGQRGRGKPGSWAQFFSAGKALYNLTCSTRPHGLSQRPADHWKSVQKLSPIRPTDWDQVVRLLFEILLFFGPRRNIVELLDDPSLQNEAWLFFESDIAISLGELRGNFNQLWPPDTGIVFRPSGPTQFAGAIGRLGRSKTLHVLQQMNLPKITPGELTCITKTAEVEEWALACLGDLDPKQQYADFRNKMDRAAAQAGIDPAQVIMVASRNLRPRNRHDDGWKWTTQNCCLITATEFGTLQQRWFSTRLSQRGGIVALFAMDGQKFTSQPFTSSLKGWNKLSTKRNTPPTPPKDRADKRGPYRKKAHKIDPGLGKLIPITKMKEVDSKAITIIADMTHGLQCDDLRKSAYRSVVLHNLTCSTLCVRHGRRLTDQWDPRQKLIPTKNSDWDQIVRLLFDVLLFVEQRRSIAELLSDPSLQNSAWLFFEDDTVISLGQLRRNFNQLWPPDTGIVFRPSGPKQFAGAIGRLGRSNSLLVLQQLNWPKIIGAGEPTCIRKTAEVEVWALACLGDLTPEQKYADFRDEMDRAAIQGGADPARVIMVASRSMSHRSSRHDGWKWKVENCCLITANDFGTLQQRWFSIRRSQTVQSVTLFAMDGEMFTASPFTSSLKGWNRLSTKPVAPPKPPRDRTGKRGPYKKKADKLLHRDSRSIIRITEMEEVDSKAITIIGDLTRGLQYDDLRQSMNKAARTLGIEPANVIVITSYRFRPTNAPSKVRAKGPRWVNGACRIGKEGFDKLKAAWFASAESRQGEIMMLFAIDGKRFTADPFVVPSSDTEER